MPAVSKKQQRLFGIIRAIKKGVFKGKKTPKIQRIASSISDKDSKKMASTKHEGLPEKVKEELNTDDKPFVKKLVGKLRKGSKTHAKQADDLEKAMNEESQEKMLARVRKAQARIRGEVNTKQKMEKANQPFIEPKKGEVIDEDYVKELEDGLVKMDYPTYDEVDKLMCKIAKENDIDTTTLHMAFKTKHLMVPDDWAKKKMFEPIMIPKTPEGLNMKEGSGDDKLKQAAKDNNLDLTDAGQRRKAMSISRRNAMKGKVNNPKGNYEEGEKMYEGNLRQWFKGSKSKDGKGGWVNVVTGGTCASDKPGEGTPKCVSSSKRASMTKAERLSAQRRKKKADPNQQSKTGAAKPTYVKTDSPRKKKKVKEEYINELETKTMLNYIDKASDSASKQLDKAKKFESKGKLKKAAKARLKMDKRESGIAMAKDKIIKRQEDKTLTSLRRSYDAPDAMREETISEAGARVGRKFSMGKVGKQYERDEYGDPIKKDGSSVLKKNVDKNPKDDKTPNTLMGEAKSPAWQRKAGKSESGGLNAKGVASYRAANPGSKLKTAVTTKPSKLKKGSKSAKRRLSFCRRMRGMKKKLTSAKTARDPNSRINKSLRKWNCSFEPETGEMIMERGPQVLGSGARQKSIHAKEGKKGTKKVSGMIKSLRRKGSILKQPLGGPADASAKARRLSYVKDDVDLTILRFIDEGHMNKTCGEGEYYCYQSKKCKKIPKGMKIGYGGMLKPIENEKDESNGKKGGSNGNGNGHGGNGNGNGGNGNGGNGGGE